MQEQALKEIAGLISQTPRILPTIYSDLAQPSVRKVGIALETVFEFSTSMLLPLKLLNEKFKMNFEKNLNNYKRKIEEIPEEKICNVNPQIGTPIIERLSYTTNEEIVDLFTSLLAKASNIDTVNIAHPSYIQIIERLSIDEARIVKFLYSCDNIPFIEINEYDKTVSGFKYLFRYATMLQFQIELMFPDNLNFYIDNLRCLGILTYREGFRDANKEVYTELFDKYEVEKLKNEYLKDENKSIRCNDKVLEITDYGREFIKTIM